jgi:hypothetical protein
MRVGQKVVKFGWRLPVDALRNSCPSNRRQSKLARVADHIARRVGDDLDQRMSAQIEGISSGREIQLYWANSSGHNFIV